MQSYSTRIYFMCDTTTGTPSLEHFTCAHIFATNSDLYSGLPGAHLLEHPLGLPQLSKQHELTNQNLLTLLHSLFSCNTRPSSESNQPSQKHNKQQPSCLPVDAIDTEPLRWSTSAGRTYVRKKKILKSTETHMPRRVGLKYFPTQDLASHCGGPAFELRR